MNSIKTVLTVVALATGLVACGGGGGSAGTPVFGDGQAAQPVTAADLLVTATPTSLQNTTSSTATVTVTAVDGQRNTLADIPVVVTADNDGLVTMQALKTDNTGKITATVGIGNNRSNRTITVKAVSGSVERTIELQVTGTAVTASAVPAVIAPGAAGKVIFQVADATGNAMANQAITVTAPGMTPNEATGTTGVNGDFTFNYTAPATAGDIKVAASSGGASTETTVRVQPISTIPMVTQTITSASVSANPSVVSVNQPGSDSRRTQIRALFLSANNQPIANVRVRFDLAGDVNSIGGTFSAGSSELLYSDANGVVTTSYIPGTRSSPTDGVTVRACYGTSDSDPNLTNCTTNAIVKLTVTNEPLGVSIGTNETIVVNDLTYVKKLVVLVVDSAGVAKPDVNLSVSVDLPQYRKGYWVPGIDRWIKQEQISCLNEDTNRNGVLEAGEDLDNDGRLDPGKSDVSVSLVNSKTGADGTAVLQIQYPKNFGSWVDAWVTVAASGVSGSEGRATYVFAPVPVPAAAVDDEKVEPAFVLSPYGTTASCTTKD